MEITPAEETSVNNRSRNPKRRAQKARLRVRIGRRKIRQIAHTPTLKGLFLSFLKIGVVGFGGGLAVISQIRTLAVNQREWLTEQEFAEAFALAQSLPGTNAGNAVTYIGLKLAGWRGALVAMVGFILPSTLMMIALAELYSQFRGLPDTERLFHGLNSAVVALILVTAWRLSRSALSKKWQWFVAVGALLAVAIFQATVLEVILCAGLIGIYFFAFGERQLEKFTALRREMLSPRRERIKQRRQQTRRRAGKTSANQSPHDFIGGHLTKALADKRTENQDENQDEKPKNLKNNRLYSFAPLAFLPFFLVNLSLLATLAIVFLRIGAVTFGGGFVMIPLIEAEVVANHHWLTPQEFADATALGQITPGPVLVTATFIGYRVAGILGAIVATICIFLPAFLFTIVAGSSLQRFRTNKIIQSFLLGVTPAVVGLLAAAAVSIGRSGIHTIIGFSIMLAAVFVLLKFRPNALWVLLGAGLIRFVIGLVLM